MFAARLLPTSAGDWGTVSRKGCWEVTGHALPCMSESVSIGNAPNISHQHANQKLFYAAVTTYKVEATLETLAPDSTL